MEALEKTVGSKLIYEGKIITVKKDTVTLENGHTASRELVEHPGGVAVVAVDDQDQMLFVSQYRYPFKKVLLELPAGKLERGENPAECGLRELSEECGYTAGQLLPIGELYPTCAYLDEIIHLFYALDLEFTGQHLDEDEFLSVRKIPVDTAVQMVLGGEIPDAKTQIGILRYKAMRDAGKL